MRNFWRPLLLLSLVLLIPIVPFLVGADVIEAYIQHWIENQTGKFQLAGVIAGLLACDVFLPIPSSMLTTFGGAKLGWLLGTLAAWFGMSVGAIVAFYVTRRWGRGIAIWLSGEANLNRTQNAVDRWGLVALVMARGVPVLAEATVLLFAMHHMPWPKFLVGVLLSNLVIAFAYATFGDWAQRQAWLPFALGISVALPLLLAAALQRHLTRLQSRREKMAER